MQWTSPLLSPTERLYTALFLKGKVYEWDVGQKVRKVNDALLPFFRQFLEETLAENELITVLGVCGFEHNTVLGIEALAEKMNLTYSVVRGIQSEAFRKLRETWRNIKDFYKTPDMLLGEYYEISESKTPVSGCQPLLWKAIGCPEKIPPLSSEFPLSMSIDELELSARPRNKIKQAGYKNVGEIVTKTESAFEKSMSNFGKKCLEELKEKLNKFNLTFAPE